jgi:hypothetical protein
MQPVITGGWVLHFINCAVLLRCAFKAVYVSPISTDAPTAQYTSPPPCVLLHPLASIRLQA